MSCVYRSNGSSFGDGIYFTPDVQTSISYSNKSRLIAGRVRLNGRNGRPARSLQSLRFHGKGSSGTAPFPPKYQPPVTYPVGTAAAVSSAVSASILGPVLGYPHNTGALSEVDEEVSRVSERFGEDFECVALCEIINHPYAVCKNASLGRGVRNGIIVVKEEQYVMPRVLMVEEEDMVGVPGVEAWLGLLSS